MYITRVSAYDGTTDDEENDIKLLAKVFPDTERYDRRDWRLYLTCRVAGHRITDVDEYGDRYCTRCGDTMFGTNRWQS